MFQDKFTHTSFGRLHYLEAGTGEPLILLHSNGGSAYEYEHVIAPLAQNFRVLAWDMPGQGDSDPLLKHASVEDYARAVIEMMDSLAIKQAFVLGASIGGAICVALGAHYPQRMKRVLITECPFRAPEEWAGNWANTEANYCPVTQSIEKILPRLRHVTPELHARWNIDRSKAGSKTCLSVMWALREYQIGADLAKVPANQVLIFGDRSPTVGKLKAFEAVLKNPSVHVIQECGHFPMLDDPDAFVAIINAETRS